MFFLKTLIYFRYINALDNYLVEIGVKINFLINTKAKDISVLLVSFFDIKHFINKYRLHEHVYIEYQL